jgi:nitrate/nitrite-specific signal transduction histidine kinase
MRERLALLDGTCTVESQPGNGTRVVIHLPLGPKTLVGLDQAQARG